MWLQHQWQGDVSPEIKTGLLEPGFHGLGVLLYWGCHHRAPQTSWLQRSRDLPHGSEGWESKIRVLTELTPSEDGWKRICSPLLDIQMSIFSLRFFQSSSMCIIIQNSPSHKNTSHVVLGPIHPSDPTFP